MRAAVLAGMVSAASLAVPGAEDVRADDSMHAGLQGSTLGLGLTAGYDFSEHFTVRGLFNRFELSYDTDVSGNEYEGNLELQSFGLSFDWHPFSSGFRLSSGAFLNNNEVSASASGELEIGDEKYSGEMNILLDFERIAPYVGVGWTSDRREAGLGFAIDAGLLYQGSPRISGSGSTSSCTFELSAGGDAAVSSGPCQGLRGDLESEHGDLMDGLDDFRWYPVLSLGVLYRF